MLKMEVYLNNATRWNKFLDETRRKIYYGNECENQVRKISSCLCTRVGNL